MQVHTIRYSKRFVKQLKKLPHDVQQRAIKQEQVFKRNPYHPSLRLHKLSGRLRQVWSISITMNYRIMFQVFENGDTLFVSIGTHAIYER